MALEKTQNGSLVMLMTIFHFTVAAATEWLSG